MYYIRTIIWLLCVGLPSNFWGGNSPNGQTEGQVTKLKLVNRQMYGRAELDLLRARLPSVRQA